MAPTYTEPPVWDADTPFSVERTNDLIGQDGNLDWLRDTLFAESGSELTISGGVVTVTEHAFFTIDTESDAGSDDLATINGGEAGEIIVLAAANAGRTVVVKHGTGNILLGGGYDLPLVSTSQLVMLRYDGTNWIEINGGADRIGVFGTSLSGGGAAILDGNYTTVPLIPRCYLLGFYALADASGSITISVRNKGSFGVPAGGDEIESVVISSAQTYSDTTLTGVTREQAPGSWAFVADGDATDITQLEIVALVVKL